MNLLDRLAEAGVEFVVVGGFAGIVHGCTYVTQDIDICCNFSQKNLLKLQQGISDVHPVHRMTPGKKEFKLTKQDSVQYKNLYLDTDIGQLDCLGIIDGVGDFVEVKKASETLELEGIRVHVLSLDALVKAKKATGRPRDIEMIKQLENIKKLKEQG